MKKVTSKKSPTAPPERDYQKLTEQIASEAGLQLDGKQYFDPLHRIKMTADFYRTIRDSRLKILRVSIALVLFILPGLFWLCVIVPFFFTNSFNDLVNILAGVFYCLIGVVILRGKR